MKPLFSPQPLRLRARETVPAILLACVAGLASMAPALAQTAVPAEPDPKAILMRMADYVAQLPAFSVDVRDSYDTVQESGQKIEFAETRKITVARPDRMRLDVVESDGERQTLVIDAKNITITSEPDDVYAQTPSPGDLDQAVVHFVRDLKMRLPLALLFLTSLPGELEQRTQALDYVEVTSILGTPAHHLAGRTDSVDYQFWIADGDQPLLLRVVLTYVEEKGQPQFRAQLSDWNLSPRVTDVSFSSVPPQGAQRIAFLAEMPASAPEESASESKSAPAADPGEKQ